LVAPEWVRDSMQYCVVRVNADTSIVIHDELYARARRYNVCRRRYLFSRCSELSCYQSLPSAHPANLPVAYEASGAVLALPFYRERGTGGAHRVCNIVEYICKGRAA
jgi:hypothetical protein